jgi:hypothetical protein
MLGDHLVRLPVHLALAPDDLHRIIEATTGFET